MGSLIDEFEVNYWEQGKLVVGIDEAGRGPMAGPCVVSGVIFPKGYYDARINDSKQLSEKQRDELVSIIESNALWTFTEIIPVDIIDRDNIYRATQNAMKKIAIESKADIVLTDAMPLDDITIPVEAIVKGDARSLSIATASILAKTVRDGLMKVYDLEFPEYGFAKHKGYGTKQHKEAILKFGRCPIHRKSFRFKDETQISFDI
ncbi:ribonuclease HII [Erysipelothrix rhusiopathiae]|uniref:ribonuclease HII n=1 Tax=Erysipelothrix rhusiopathiae TaxID=1648 RepID=UPI002B24FE35|nr:ribonuclease HII [Erysipelothrix rhusiopathiae]WRB92723.1 ribonuclease HII [Erysipelothrix rhusiopathiae]